MKKSHFSDSQIIAVLTSAHPAPVIAWTEAPRRPPPIGRAALAEQALHAISSTPGCENMPERSTHVMSA